MDKSEKNAPSMFHPIHERDKGAWLPANDVGYIASNISHAWEDIQCLSLIRQKCSTNYEEKLLFKYIVVELRSVIEQLDKLQGIIFRLINGEPVEQVPNGHISDEQADELRLLFKKYHSIKNKLEKDIIDIRNTIGAHRGNQPWTDIMEMWDKLDPEIFRPLFSTISELFNFIIELDIFDWTRIPKKGAVEICVSGLNQP